MKLEDSTQNKLQKGGKLLAELVIIIIIAGATASLATRAAFPRLANVSLSETAAYWQEDDAHLASNLPARATEKPEATTTPEEPTLSPAFAPPRVSAKSYVVADVASGAILASKQPARTFPIASISKLMTAVVASETIDVTEQITTSEEAIATYGAAGGLRAGDTLTMETFYYPLLLESSNDAAVAIAEHADFDRFLNLMNRKALVLNMGSTRFRDPSGLADENTSSARDLLQLARYIYNQRPHIFEITTRGQQLAEEPDSIELRNFTNNNPMVGRADFIGGKNGYTDNARHTLLSVFASEVAGEERDVVIIVLGAESHVEDTLSLLSWLERAF